MAPPRGAFLVAFHDDVPVGCGGLRTLEPGVGEVKRMYVAPAARGHGLGRQLLAALEAEAVALGLLSVRLDTHSSMPEAEALYRSAGYRPRPAYNRHAYADRWFEKDLRGAAGHAAVRFRP